MRGPKVVEVEKEKIVEVEKVITITDDAKEEPKTEENVEVEQDEEKEGSDPQSGRFQDLKNNVEVNATTKEEKIEGKTSTDVSEIVEADSSSAAAVEDIIDRIEDEKIQEDLNNNPEKEIVSTPEDSSVVTGDKNTGKNKNTVVQENETVKPFEDSKIEDVNQTTENTEKEEKEETVEKKNGAYDLFVDSEDSENEEEVVAEKMPEFNMEASEENETTPVFEQEKAEESEKETAVDDDAATKIAEEVATAPVAGKLENTYLKVSGNVATLVVTEGEFVQADAGDGVEVTINGDTIEVKILDEGSTVVVVDLLDTLGNITSCVVAFN